MSAMAMVADPRHCREFRRCHRNARHLHLSWWVLLLLLLQSLPLWWMEALAKLSSMVALRNLNRRVVHFSLQVGHPVPASGGQGFRLDVLA